jgi:Holliday junction resolvase RusA-like endonuclease
MCCFIVERRPVSYNSDAYRGTRKANYHDEIRQNYPSQEVLSFPKEKDVTGVLAYFCFGYNSNTSPDADNISKPVWDGLRGVAFEDDKQVVARFAQVVDLDRYSLSSIDVTVVPPLVLQRIFDLAEKRESFFVVSLVEHLPSNFKLFL